LQLRNKINALRQSPILSDLNDSEVADLADIAIDHGFTQGEFIFQEGDAADRFYIIAEGKIKIFKHSSLGSEFIIAFFGPYNMFGAVAALTDKPYPCSARAEVETRVIEVEKEDFLPFIIKHPQVALRIIRVFGERLIESQDRLRDLAVERVEQRLLKTLLRLFSSYGSDLPFTRQEIAEMTGTTTETVIRVFSHLKEEDIIQSARGKIIIVDDKKLRMLCQESPQ
jgi:CRP-like cAMP-binding protein